MIGVFDSGLGGLTVLKELRRQLPEYDYIYLGDNARAPYGSKSPDVIYQYCQEAVDFLFSQGCEIIIFACNTASAEALRRIQREYLPQTYAPKRVLGVIRPTVEMASEMTHNGVIGVMATQGTVDSHAYYRELKHLNRNLQVVEKSAPLIVPLIEEGWHNRPVARHILRQYLKPFKDYHLDIFILGCTHYPLMMKDLKRMMGKKVQVLSSADCTVHKFKDYLARHPEIEAKLHRHGQLKFFTTDTPDRFTTTGEKFLGEPIRDITKIML